MLRMIAPIGGTAVVTFRGLPVLSKAHGSADLLLHVPLAFHTSAVLPTASDALLSLNGASPALVFEDEQGSNTAAGTDLSTLSPSALSLYKPDGHTELRLLGGRLLLSDGTDARWQCGTGSSVAWSPPQQVSRFEFDLPANLAASAVITLAGANGQQLVTLAARYNAAGAATLTVGGVSRFMVDGVDVHQTWQSCR